MVEISGNDAEIEEDTFTAEELQALDCTTTVTRTFLKEEVVCTSSQTGKGGPIRSGASVGKGHISGGRHALGPYQQLSRTSTSATSGPGPVQHTRTMTTTTASTAKPSLPLTDTNLPQSHSRPVPSHSRGTAGQHPQAAAASVVTGASAHHAVQAQPMVTRDTCPSAHVGPSLPSPLQTNTSIPNARVQQGSAGPLVACTTAPGAVATAGQLFPQQSFMVGAHFDGSKCPGQSLDSIDTAMRCQSLASHQPTIQASHFKEYIQQCVQCLDSSDCMTVQGKLMVKKSGWRKLGAAMGVSYQIVEKNHKFNDNGTIGSSEFVVRAILPSGRFSEGYGAADIRERKGANNPTHNVPALAETRAKSRALQDLLGVGDAKE